MDEIGLSQNAQHRQHGAEDKENEDQHNGAALFLRHEPVAQTHQSQRQQIRQDIIANAGNPVLYAAHSPGAEPYRYTSLCRECMAALVLYLSGFHGIILVHNSICDPLSALAAA